MTQPTIKHAPTIPSLEQLSTTQTDRIFSRWQLSFARARPLALPVIFAIGLILLQPSVTSNSDISWIISLCERLLHGERLYINILEVNPPATVWLYLPFVALADRLHISPETVINFEVWSLAAATIGLSWKILTTTKSFDRFDGATLFWLAAFALTVLPVNSFGQREHFCTLLILPALALCLHYTENQRAAPALQVLAGICAGLAVAIKPHIGLALALPYLILCWRNRSLRFLVSPEILAAAVVFTSYLAAIFCFTPAYLIRMLPILTAAYLPDRAPIVVLLANFGMVVWLLAMAIIYLLWRNQKANAATVILGMASFGALGLYLVQGKGWHYHTLPMMILACLALAFVLTDTSRGDRLSVKPLLLSLCMLAGGQFWFNHRVSRPQLLAAIHRLSAHPSLLAISGNIALGHPLVREVGGTWVGRECAQWAFLAIGHQYKQAELDPQGFAKAHPRLAAIIQMETAMLAQDITTRHPDIILEDRQGDDWGRLAQNWPAVQLQLTHYVFRGTFNNVAILQRIMP